MNGKSHRALNSSIDEILNNNLRNNLLEEKKKTLDPVGKEDSDIDNDGDVDSNDEYLHNKRKKIGKAIKKVKTGRPKKPRKTINERKFEILNSLLSEMGGMDSHPFDAESGSDEFDSAMVMNSKSLPVNLCMECSHSQNRWGIIHTSNIHNFPVSVCIVAESVMLFHIITFQKKT